MSRFKNINWSPEKYIETAVVAQETGDAIFDRLSLMTIKPQIIVDLGCGAGTSLSKLRMQFPDAKVIAIDNNQTMLDFVAMQNEGVECIYANAENISLPDASVDFILAHFLLPWHDNLKSLLQEAHRVLRPNGLLMLSALGPDTLQEVDEKASIPNLIDMHDLGDALVQEGFSDPVMEVNHYQLAYRDKSNLFYELSASGLWLSDETINLSPNDNGKYQVTVEAIIGHAWRSDTKNKYAPDGSVRIPVSVLKRV
ncbi:MAG: hypothetical protein ACD_46C00044G0006 [uncultured bacterium]|nr:MAG: hypothetical protein ACD_46C00044G0006 [uncultured bacterium]